MHTETTTLPGIVIASLRGGSGKTLFSVGIIAALRQLGKTIAPFKKGPDYIDAGWLALAAGRRCCNLDTFLIPLAKILQSFRHYTLECDLAVIEGNRGLYDSFQKDGKTSTAELAKQLGLPVILCINGTKATRTMAAVVSGCLQFDPAVKIAGVVLNHVAGSRHERLLRSSIEYHTGIHVLGAVPKLGKQGFPERHMGLVPTAEHAWANEKVASIAHIATQYLDLKAILSISAMADAPLPQADTLLFSKETSQTATQDSINIAPYSNLSDSKPPTRKAPRMSVPTIGVIKDSAFQFYYPENFDALMDCGAELDFFGPLTHKELPAIDALYIGGGFPETHAGELAQNKSFRTAIRKLAEIGLPIYAECGGLMYLGKALVLEGKTYPMCGVLPIIFGVSKRPQGHGYTIIKVSAANPFYEVGTELKGHEFHYSRVLKWGDDKENLAFTMVRGSGLRKLQDGIIHRNVLATYTHIHAHGTPQWAPAIVEQARLFQKRRQNQTFPQ